MQKLLTCGVLLLGTLLIPNLTRAHTPEQRQADLADELKRHFDPSWIEYIFDNQNLCEGKSLPQKKLSGWSELRSLVMSEESLLRGEKFFRTHEILLRIAAGRFDDCKDLPYIILAILRVESDFGENRSGAPVVKTLFERYHRIQDGPLGDSGRTYVFKKAILPFFHAAEINNWNVCEIRGSRAAAFGYPHFIPDSLTLAADGDADGKVDIVWSLPDATHSIASFLVRAGYPRNHKRAIYRYNPNWRYVSIVWDYAKAIRGRVE